LTEHPADDYASFIHREELPVRSQHYFLSSFLCQGLLSPHSSKCSIFKVIQRDKLVWGLDWDIFKYLLSSEKRKQWIMKAKAPISVRHLTTCQSLKTASSCYYYSSQ